MKALFIGIFILIAVGILYFTVQVIKSPSFKTSLTPPASTFNANNKVFADINHDFSLVLPDDWSLVKTGTFKDMPDMAPVFTAQSGRYATVQTELYDRRENIDADIEYANDKMPISQSVSAITGEQMDLKVTQVKKITFKNGVSGFVMKFKGKTSGDVLVYQQVTGTMYAYYVRGQIMVAYALHLHNENPVDSTFLQNAEKVFQEIIIY